MWRRLRTFVRMRVRFRMRRRVLLRTVPRRRARPVLLEALGLLPMLLGNPRHVEHDFEQLLLLRRVLRLRRLQLRDVLERMAQRSAAVLRSLRPLRQLDRPWRLPRTLRPRVRAGSSFVHANRRSLREAQHDRATKNGSPSRLRTVASSGRPATEVHFGGNDPPTIKMDVSQPLSGANSRFAL
jgi:hypothetical protein